MSPTRPPARPAISPSPGGGSDESWEGVPRGVVLRRPVVKGKSHHPARRPRHPGRRPRCPERGHPSLRLLPEKTPLRGVPSRKEPPPSEEPPRLQRTPGCLERGTHPHQWSDVFAEKLLDNPAQGWYNRWTGVGLVGKCRRLYPPRPRMSRRKCDFFLENTS